jgi:predicted metal-dependent enzyme (double-stranded beta helix superfamily)
MVQHVDSKVRKTITVAASQQRAFHGPLVDRGDNHVGDVGGFAPPGDIHRVHNTGDTTAISIHIYGTDVTRTGSSVRRYYDRA